MQVKLDYYDLIDAIENKLDSTFEGSIDLHSRELEIFFETLESDEQPKKHKNGRIVKDAHGNTVFETVGQKVKHHNFSENDELFICFNCDP
ncbi:MAG: hypothetical protein CL942_15765 [Desulfovibrio sp.]|nr:hypothetical protein [Desulfovibrio sp.]MBC18494.1 hypothetical protein [Desulfovibrio sp.]|tara:strand:- start:2136 stop:2408 length:273 start_codon:yes stop_codon:yes gene_type:complete